MNFNICKKCKCNAYLAKDINNNFIIICTYRENGDFKIKQTYQYDKTTNILLEKSYKESPIKISDIKDNEIKFLSKITSLVKENCTCFAEQLIDSYNKGK